MAQSTPWIIVDNRQASWSSVGPGWIEQPGREFFDGTCVWARYNDTTYLSVNFTGIGMSFYGNAISSVPWNYTSSIDSGTPEYHAMTQEDGFRQLSYPWYTSPEVGEGNHTLALTSISQGVALDYLLIKPSRTQNLNGNRLAVDDEDTLMHFTGNWSVVADRYPNAENTEPGHYFVPHGGKTHVSNRVGDVLQFPFTGTSVHVYGFFDWTSSGKIGLSFTLDDMDWATEKIVYPREGTERGTLSFQPNFLYYQTTVPAGDHILTMNVTNAVGGQKVIIDVIYYTAAFESLETMPQITVPSLTTNSSSSESPSSNPEGGTSSSTSPAGNGANVGAIVGGAVGGGVGIVLALVLVWLIMRRKRERRTAEPTASMITEPFTPPDVSTSAGATRLVWSDGTPVVTPLPSYGKSGSYPHATSSSSEATAQVGPSVRHVRDPRVEELERQVQQLARRTEELQVSQNRDASAPPAYQEVKF